MSLRSGGDESVQQRPRVDDHVDGHGCHGDQEDHEREQGQRVAADCGDECGKRREELPQTLVVDSELLLQCRIRFSCARETVADGFEVSRYGGPERGGLFEYARRDEPAKSDDHHPDDEHRDERSDDAGQSSIFEPGHGDVEGDGRHQSEHEGQQDNLHRVE